MVGTAFGVAVLSQVYLVHINTTLASSLAASRVAASQFVILGEGASRLLAEGAIVQGFKLTALACFILCGSAMILALFMRPRSIKKVVTPPVEAEAQISSTDRTKLRRMCVKNNLSGRVAFFYIRLCECLFPGLTVLCLVCCYWSL